MIFQIAGFISPLLISFVIGLGILASQVYRKKSISMLPVIVLFWIASAPIFTESLVSWLESKTRPFVEAKKNEQMIVVLGGGIYAPAPEYADSEAPSDVTLVRLSYGAELHRVTGLPIFVSGGNPLSNRRSEADLMANLLKSAFGITATGIEADSLDTAENATFSFTRLHVDKVQRIVLVTHASHMARAATLFRRAGFEVTEAPTRFTTSIAPWYLRILPTPDGVRAGAIFLREVIGYIRSGINPLRLGT